MPKIILNSSLKLLLPIFMFYDTCQSTLAVFQNVFSKCELQTDNWKPGWRVTVGQAVINAKSFYDILIRAGH